MASDPVSNILVMTCVVPAVVAANAQPSNCPDCSGDRRCCRRSGSGGLLDHRGCFQRLLHGRLRDEDLTGEFFNLHTVQEKRANCCRPAIIQGQKRVFFFIGFLCSISNWSGCAGASPPRADTILRRSFAAKLLLQLTAKAASCSAGTSSEGSACPVRTGIYQCARFQGLPLLGRQFHRIYAHRRNAPHRCALFGDSAVTPGKEGRLFVTDLYSSINVSTLPKRFRVSAYSFQRVMCGAGAENSAFRYQGSQDRPSQPTR